MIIVMPVTLQKIKFDFVVAAGLFGQVLFF